VLNAVDDQAAASFWRQDIDRYTATDLAPVQCKLGRLLISGSISLMLSQGDSAIDFADVMDSGKILLVDLSRVGPEARGILGCFVLSSLHIAAPGRGTEPVETPRPFHIYCDGAHRFMTEAMEDLLAEGRRLNVSLTLAHQCMGQFSNRETDALSSVGSRIVFNVDVKDAQYLQEDLQGAADVGELTSLGIGRAIARIGSRVIRLETDPPPQAPKDHCRDLIIARSRAKYCRPAAEVRRIIADRHGR
jgi:hypothetical protein